MVIVKGILFIEVFSTSGIPQACVREDQACRTGSMQRKELKKSPQIDSKLKFSECVSVA